MASSPQPVPPVPAQETPPTPAPGLSPELQAISADAQTGLAQIGATSNEIKLLQETFGKDFKSTKVQLEIYASTSLKTIKQISDLNGTVSNEFSDSIKELSDISKTLASEGISERKLALKRLKSIEEARLDFIQDEKERELYKKQIAETRRILERQTKLSSRIGDVIPKNFKDVGGLLKSGVGKAKDLGGEFVENAVTGIGSSMGLPPVFQKMLDKRIQSFSEKRAAAREQKKQDAADTLSRITDREETPEPISSESTSEYTPPPELELIPAPAPSPVPSGINGAANSAIGANPTPSASPAPISPGNAPESSPGNVNIQLVPMVSGISENITKIQQSIERISPSSSSAPTNDLVSPRSEIQESPESRESGGLVDRVSELANRVLDQDGTSSGSGTEPTVGEESPQNASGGLGSLISSFAPPREEGAEPVPGNPLLSQFSSLLGRDSDGTSSGSGDEVEIGDDVQKVEVVNLKDIALGGFTKEEKKAESSMFSGIIAKILAVLGAFAGGFAIGTIIDKLFGDKIQTLLADLGFGETPEEKQNKAQTQQFEATLGKTKEKLLLEEAKKAGGYDKIKQEKIDEIMNDDSIRVDASMTGLGGMELMRTAEGRAQIQKTAVERARDTRIDLGKEDAEVFSSWADDVLKEGNTPDQKRELMWGEEEADNNKAEIDNKENIVVAKHGQELKKRRDAGLATAPLWKRLKTDGLTPIILNLEKDNPKIKDLHSEYKKKGLITTKEYNTFLKTVLDSGNVSAEDSSVISGVQSNLQGLDGQKPTPVPEKPPLASVPNAAKPENVKPEETPPASGTTEESAKPSEEKKPETTTPAAEEAKPGETPTPSGETPATEEAKPGETPTPETQTPSGETPPTDPNAPAHAIPEPVPGETPPGVTEAPASDKVEIPPALEAKPPEVVNGAFEQTAELEQQTEQLSETRVTANSTVVNNYNTTNTTTTTGGGGGGGGGLVVITSPSEAAFRDGFAAR